MSQIKLITPPDKLLNENKSILLVNLKDIVKDEFNKIIKDINININLYMYDELENRDSANWLIETSSIVDYIILDIDNTGLDNWLIGYLLAKNNTFFICQDIPKPKPYNLISSNRIYTLDPIKTILEDLNDNTTNTKTTT
jgi:hypothetical protein